MRFRKILFGDHPYSILVPTEADVNKITLQDIKTYVAQNFTPDRAHLYIAGKFETAAVKRAIEQSLGPWPKGTTARTPNLATPAPHPTLDVSDRPGASQSTLLVGLPVTAPQSPDALPLSVTNALLGGSFNSRITANIREQKGYTYSPFGYIARNYHEAF